MTLRVVQERCKVPWNNIKEGTEEPSMSELGSEGHGDSLDVS